jgi:putative SOS response-associated peptidase YedK
VVVATEERFTNWGPILFRHRKRRRRRWRERHSAALDYNFRSPETEGQRETKRCIDEYNAQCSQEWENEVFMQRRRLANAEQSLETKVTKTAQKEARIADDKVRSLLERLAKLRRSEPDDEDSRIFPMVYAPVLVRENDRTVIRPMRYTCRVAGKPADYDFRFPATYNARRDSLGEFWNRVYGRHHAVLVITGFYENVPRHLYEHRDLRPGEDKQNLVLEFDPHPRKEILVACVWDRWTQTGAPDLDSFAAVTDDFPEEIAATGHQRCVISLREENLEQWLTPAGVSRERLEAILSERRSILRAPNRGMIPLGLHFRWSNFHVAPE